MILCRTMIGRRWCLATALLVASVIPANAGYVTGVWSTNTIHILDNSFNSISSFSAEMDNPNGVATDGQTIWVGTFTNGGFVNAFDFAGTLLYSWTGSLSSLQGMELVNGELAIANSDTEFYNPVSGAFIRSIPGGSSVEGLAFDGTDLWALGDFLERMDPSDGTNLGSVPSAGSSCDYGGTGFSNGPGGTLAIGCAGGSWFVVSKADGSVISSGNNGLEMYGLGYFDDTAVPEPGTAGLLIVGLLAVGMRARR